MSVHVSHIRIRNKCVSYAYNCTHTATNAVLFFMTLLIYERMYAYSRFPLSEQKNNVVVPVTTFTQNTDTDP